MKKLLTLATPFTVVAAVLIAHPTLAGLVQSAPEIGGAAPYVLMIMAAGLALYYDRLRITLGLAVAILTFWSIRSHLQISLDNKRAFDVFLLTSTFAPLLLASFTVVPERGVRSRFAMGIYLGFALAALAWIVPVPDLDGSLAQAFGSVLTIRYVNGPLTLAATLALALALVVVLSFYFVRDDQYATVAYSMIIFVGATFVLFAWENISVIFFSVMAVLLIAAQIRSAHDLAYRDELTGLLSRRAFDQRLRSLGSRFTIAMLDIDHFKKFNDTHGHDVGDEVLRMVAKKIGAVGGGGVPFRYGGEEFSVVFAGKTREHAKPHLEAVRSTIEDYEMRLRNTGARNKNQGQGEARRGRRREPREKLVSVTISIGTAEPKPKKAAPLDVLKAADQALYRAKKAGRNRVV